MSENDDVTEVLCDNCNSSIDPDNGSVLSDDNETLCLDCMFSCERCDYIGNRGSDDYQSIDGDEIWCNACTEAHASWCERHEEYVTRSMYYIQDVGESWCVHCAEDRASWCETCDEYYADGCEECMNSRDIHDYNYRPDPIFRLVEGENTKLYFGIEIETEVSRNGHDITACSEYAAQILEHEHDLAYLKHDGSLNNGFEIVTHPASHAYYKQEDNPLWAVLESLRNTYQMKSWDTGTCGLHIHISRAGFSSGSHQHRFLQLIYSNPEFYSTLAGREASHWAKFDDVVRAEREYDAYGSSMGYKQWRSYKHKLEHHNNNRSDRYSAVNTLNRHTLEMRIFRGSVNGRNVKAALDLAHASVEYTRELRVPDVWADALVAENFMEYIRLNAELYPELNERMNRLFTLTNAE